MSLNAQQLFLLNASPRVITRDLTIANESKELQNLFGIPEVQIHDKIAYRNLFDKIIGYDEGQTFLIKLISEQNQPSPLIYKYHLRRDSITQLQKYLFAIVDLTIIQLKHNFNQAEETYLIFKAKLQRIRRVFKVAHNRFQQETMNASSQVEKDEIQLLTDRADSFIRNIEGTMNFVEFLELVSQGVYSLNNINETLDQLKDVRDSVIQENPGSTTIFDRLMLRPQFLGSKSEDYESDEALCQEWWNLNPRGFLDLLFFQSKPQQQLTLYYLFKLHTSNSQLNKLFEIIFIVDTVEEIPPNLVNQMADDLLTMSLGELEVWKLYISERLAFSGEFYLRAAFSILSSTEISWNGTCSSLVKKILDRCQQLLQNPQFVTQRMTFNQLRHVLTELNEDTPREPRGFEVMVPLEGWNLDSGLARRI